MERKNGLITAIERLWAFFGGTCGLLGIALMIFKGGAALQQLQTVTADNAALHAEVSKLREGATTAASVHIKEDDARDAQMRADIKTLQEAIKENVRASTEIQVKIGQLAQKLDDWMAFQGPPKKGTP